MEERQVSPLKMKKKKTFIWIGAVILAFLLMVNSTPLFSTFGVVDWFNSQPKISKTILFWAILIFLVVAYFYKEPRKR